MKAKQVNPLLLTIARRAVPVLDERPPFALTKKEIMQQMKLTKAQLGRVFSDLSAEGKLHTARVWDVDTTGRRRYVSVYWVDE